jgi:hypothetical protein
VQRQQNLHFVCKAIGRQFSQDRQQKNGESPQTGLGILEISSNQKQIRNLSNFIAHGTSERCFPIEATASKDEGIRIRIQTISDFHHILRQVLPIRVSRHNPGKTGVCSMDMSETGSQGSTLSAVVSMMDHVNAIFQAQLIEQVGKIQSTAVIYDQNIGNVIFQQAVDHREQQSCGLKCRNQYRALHQNKPGESGQAPPAGSAGSIVGKEKK